MKKSMTTLAAAGALAAVTLTGVPAANAATFGGFFPTTSGSTPTAPSHDESLRPIPVCAIWKAPSWLYNNFSDHGDDIAASFSSGDFVGMLTAIPQYAFNDAMFHLPATLTTVGGCL